MARTRPGGQQSPVALNTLAYVAGLEGDRPRQEALFRQSLAVYQAQGDTAGSAAVLSWLGTLRRGEGDLDAATALLDESLRLYQVTGTIDGMAYDLLHLGGVATARQDFEGALLRHRRQELQNPVPAREVLASSPAELGDPRIGGLRIRGGGHGLNSSTYVLHRL